MSLKKIDCDYWPEIDLEWALLLLREEMVRSEKKHGALGSPHEIYAVLLEEVEEFWDSVKEDDPDPRELVQIANVAIRGLVTLCDRAYRRKNVPTTAAGIADRPEEDPRS